MTRTLSVFLAVIFATAGIFAASCAWAQATPQELDIGPKYRARIAKEKAKHAVDNQVSSQLGGLGPDGTPQCGSQNIGNIDTNGFAAPREVFIFAPNAINMVSNGCK